MTANAPADDAVDVALRVTTAIELAESAYFVGGSLTSSLQGEPRATNDVDIVLTLPLGRLHSFVQALGSDFEVDIDMLRDALLRGQSANIFYLPAVLKIDLFGVGPSPYDEAEFSRRRAVKVRASGEELVLKSPEDTVLRKLLWYRAGGSISERQWRDVVEVLRISGAGMDDGYLDRWANQLALSELLQKASAASRSP